MCGATAIDWNGNGILDAPGLAWNINPSYDSILSVLTDNNDWATVSFAGLSDIDGARVVPPEVIVEQPVPDSAKG